MAANDFELVANFCNHTEDPLLFTLPIKFCDYNVFCEEFLRGPFIIVVLLGVVTVVYALVVLIWDLILHHIVGNFIDLSERDRMEYMLYLAGQVSRRDLLEERFREDAQQRAVAPAQVLRPDNGKEAPTTP
jgi:hypothetical protein